MTSTTFGFQILFAITHGNQTWWHPMRRCIASYISVPMATLKWARGECIHLLNEEYHRTWAKFLNSEQLRHINCSFQKYLVQIPWLILHNYPTLTKYETCEQYTIDSMAYLIRKEHGRWYIDGVTNTKTERKVYTLVVLSTWAGFSLLILVTHHSHIYTFVCSITVLASCVMNLKDFPLDKQECQLKFGSCK